GAPAPEEAPRQAMPADDTLGSDHDQMSAPVSAESTDHHPEQLVVGAQLRSPPSRPCQYAELMTEQEILGHQRVAVTHGRADEAEEEQERYSSIARTACRTARRAVPPDFCILTGTWRRSSAN